MLKNFVVGCCALVAIAGQWVIEPPQARGQFGGGRGATVERDPEKTAAERIEAALKQPLTAPLVFDEQPLNEVTQLLEDEYDIPIVFDKSALDEVAISPSTEITINLRNISLQSALNLMFREPGLEDLTYIVDQEVLLVTTRERADENLVIRVYRVDDFDLEQRRPEGDVTGFTPLLEVIHQCVENDSWAINGTGTGQIHALKPGMLVVAQTPSVQRKIESLLAAMRSVKADIGRGAFGGSTYNAARSPQPDLAE